MRAATAATSSWNESEWRARLEVGPTARPPAQQAAERAERDADRDCARQGHSQARRDAASAPVDSGGPQAEPGTDEEVDPERGREL